MKGKIGHIVLAVSYWEKSEAFYDKLMFTMGFEEAFHEQGDWGHVKSYKQDGHELEIAYEKAVAGGIRRIKAVLE